MNNLSLEQEERLQRLWEQCKKQADCTIINDDHKEYSQGFEEETIVIPARESITMPYGKGKRFFYSFSGSNPNMPGRIKANIKRLRIVEPTPEAIKKIYKVRLNALKSMEDYQSLEEEDTKPTTVGKPVCPLCSKEFKTVKGLSIHLNKVHKES